MPRHKVGGPTEFRVLEARQNSEFGTLVCKSDQRSPTDDTLNEVGNQK